MPNHLHSSRLAGTFYKFGRTDYVKVMESKANISPEKLKTYMIILDQHQCQRLAEWMAAKATSTVCRLDQKTLVVCENDEIF